MGKKLFYVFHPKQAHARADVSAKMSNQLIRYQLNYSGHWQMFGLLNAECVMVLYRVTRVKRRENERMVVFNMLRRAKQNHKSHLKYAYILCMWICVKCKLFTAHSTNNQVIGCRHARIHIIFLSTQFVRRFRIFCARLVYGCVWCSSVFVTVSSHIHKLDCIVLYRQCARRLCNLHKFSRKWYILQNMTSSRIYCRYLHPYPHEVWCRSFYARKWMRTKHIHTNT